MKGMPSVVGKFVNLCNAWVVGSAAIADVDTDKLKDWDLLVPYSDWPHAAAMIPKDAKPNTFGGWKFEADGMLIDVWPDDVAHYLTSSFCKVLWHPRSNSRFIRSTK